jgi:hypothetical protein
MERDMLIPFLAIPLAASFIAVADNVPTLDVGPSCRGAAAAGYINPSRDRVKTCLDSEQHTRDDLAKNWTMFPATDRADCIASIIGFEPTYTELATCLEMKRDSSSGSATTGGPGTPEIPRRMQTR